MIYPLIAAPIEVLVATPVVYSATACHDHVNSARRLGWAL